MNQVVVGAFYSVALFVGILLMLAVGRYIRNRRSGQDIEAKGAGLAVLEGALFGLMSLILAFCFAGAGTRFDAHRQLIVDEANKIGTAYLRLDLLPTPAQPELREQFRQYVDARLGAYRAIHDEAKARAEFARAVAIQQVIWTKAITACRQVNLLPVPQLLLPALNEMFDIANSRYMATQMHPPKAIYILMVVLVLVCALLAGYRMGARQSPAWLHGLAFATLLAITIYITIDMEFPRLGLIQEKAFDQAIVDVRNSMETGAAPVSKE